MPPTMGYTTARSRLMSLLSAFALMAMIVRGLVPAGYMLAAPEQPGQFVNIVICHGDGTGYSPAVLDLKTGKYADPKDQNPGKTDEDVVAQTAGALLGSTCSMVTPESSTSSFT